MHWKHHNKHEVKLKVKNSCFIKYLPLDGTLKKTYVNPKTIKSSPMFVNIARNFNTRLIPS